MERARFTKSAIAIATIISLLSVSSPAYAQERLLPEWHECFYEGKRWACYTLEETKALLVLEEKAKSWKDRLSLREEQLSSFRSLTKNLASQITTYRKQIEEYRRWNKELIQQLEVEIEQKNKYRAEADSIKIWPLLVGGIIGILGAGFGVGVLLSEKF